MSAKDIVKKPENNPIGKGRPPGAKNKTTLFKEALEGRQRKLGEEHPGTLETKHNLAVLYREQARYANAEQLLLEAFEGRRLKLGESHPRTVESLKQLVNLFETWGKPELAEKWQVRLQQQQETE